MGNYEASKFWCAQDVAHMLPNSLQREQEKVHENWQYLAALVNKYLLIFSSSSPTLMQDIRKAHVFVVGDDVPTKAYMMAALNGGCLLTAVVFQNREGVRTTYSKEKFKHFCSRFPSLFCSPEFTSAEKSLSTLLRWAVSEGHWKAVGRQGISKDTLCLLREGDSEHQALKALSKKCCTKKDFLKLLTQNCVDYGQSCRVKSRQ